VGDGGDDLAPVVALRAASQRPVETLRMAGMVREWLAELKVMGRSEQTIGWYRQKMEWYLDHEGGPDTLDGLSSAEVKRLLGTLIDRGLAPNTVHGFFEVVGAFANWALREGFAVDPAVVRMPPPKVPVTELGGGFCQPTGTTTHSKVEDTLLTVTRTSNRDTCILAAPFPEGTYQHPCGAHLFISDPVGSSLPSYSGYTHRATFHLCRKPCEIRSVRPTLRSSINPGASSFGSFSKPPAVRSRVAVTPQLGQPEAGALKVGIAS
jgi:hypothetical protein